MKPLPLCLAFAVLLYGCAAADPEQHFPAPVNGHNAANSLDYWGIYTADAPGGEFSRVELLAGGRYRLLTAAGQEISGVYRWDEGGSVLILTGGPGPETRFFVGENRLWLNSSTPGGGASFTKELHR